MPKPSLARITARFPSADRFERHVRAMLETRDDYFENHWINDKDEGECLPMMLATVPGQFNNSGHGVDIFALDTDSQLWLIEVSRGKREGAARFKGGGSRVAYAGHTLQMSASWRRAATLNFLAADSKSGYARVRALLDLPGAGRMLPTDVAGRFFSLYDRHKKAIILDEDGHFDTTGTDIDFRREVYTPRRFDHLLEMWTDSAYGDWR